MMPLSHKANAMSSIIALIWVVVALMVVVQEQQLSSSSSSMWSVPVVASFQPTTMFTPKSISSTTSLNVFGTKKAKKMTPEEMEKYWQGEWVCKDCGYIYNRVRFSACVLYVFWMTDDEREDAYCMFQYTLECIT